MSVLKRECSTSNGSTLYLHMSQWDPSAETLTIFNTSEYDTEKFDLRPDWELKYELQYGPNVSCTTMVVDLPKDMRFNEDIVISVVAYTCMFLVSLVGNAMVFTTLWSSRRSRVNMCILHLSVADLFIACVFLPLETSWHITVSWRAGDLACRIFMLFRAFGFYLSSHITMVIAIDRCMSIVQPLMMNGAFRRCRILLLIAYLFSFIFSLPQSIIFHVEQHPLFPWFSQCVTFNFFRSESEELAYDIFNCVAVYALPLVVIATAYTLILLKLSRQQNKHVKGTSLSKRNFWRKKSSSKLSPLYRKGLRLLRYTAITWSLGGT
uniref:G-protein coupled receptors family 1 profile domain-containing protein n=1 Tax=Biomphalaria glabrata TaxID=6526 RepID=A0A2C9LC44_BIOGL